MKKMSSERAKRRGWLVTTLVAVALALNGCRSHAPAPGVTNSAPAPAAQRTLTVFAASSLREVFTAVAAEHRRHAPDVAVTFNFAGTQELRAQIEHGARADVFAAADTKHGAELERQGLIGAATLFAENAPVLVVAQEASAAITSFAQLTAAKRVVLGAPEVPIGHYSAQILENATKTLGADFARKVQAHVVSKELNVKQVLAKVVLGEADAGIVYRSDVTGQAKGNVSVVTIPPEVNVIARYPIAVVSKSEHRADAEAWVDALTSAAGQAVLSNAGFDLPSAANSAL